MPLCCGACWLRTLMPRNRAGDPLRETTSDTADGVRGGDPLDAQPVDVERGAIRGVGADAEGLASVDPPIASMIAPRRPASRVAARHLAGAEQVDTGRGAAHAAAQSVDAAGETRDRLDAPAPEQRSGGSRGVADRERPPRPRSRPRTGAGPRGCGRGRRAGIAGGEDVRGSDDDSDARASRTSARTTEILGSRRACSIGANPFPARAQRPPRIPRRRFRRACGRLLPASRPFRDDCRDPYEWEYWRLGACKFSGSFGSQTDRRIPAARRPAPRRSRRRRPERARRRRAAMAPPQCARRLRHAVAPQAMTQQSGATPSVDSQ